jgi:S1-C subfamily serine protease
VAAATGASRGVEVVSVVASSPAATAGLRPRDLIVSVDGEPVGDVGELQSLLTERFIGRPVAIGFVRDGRLTTSQVSCVKLH